MEKNSKFSEFSDVGPDRDSSASNENQKGLVDITVKASALLESYKPFFEVDLNTVKSRLMKTLWPFNRINFFDKPADLYGAFWVPTTLIFLLGVTGKFTSLLSGSEGYSYNISAFVSIASLVYIAVGIVPGLLSLLILTDNEMIFTDLLSLYGYSFFAFCPAAVICIIKSSALRWISFGAASVWAEVLLVKNFYSEFESIVGWKKLFTFFLSASGYFSLTVAANVYLFK